MFIVGQLIMIMVEGGGFAVTELNGSLSDSAVTVVVDSTTNFLSADASHPAYAMIEDEIVSYTGSASTQFTGVTRGTSDPQTNRQSTAVAHSSNARVKTLNIAAIDSFMGYNITTSGAEFGTLDAVKLAGRTLLNMPKFLSWDYPWFTGPWVVARFLLFSLSAGFIISLSLAMLGLAQSLWRP